MPTNEVRDPVFDPIEEFKAALTPEMQLDIFAQGVRVGDQLRGGFFDRFEVTDREELASGRIRICARDNPVSNNQVVLTLKPMTQVWVYRAAAKTLSAQEQGYLALKNQVSTHASLNSSSDPLAPFADLLLTLCKDVEKLTEAVDSTDREVAILNRHQHRHGRDTSWTDGPSAENL